MTPVPLPVERSRCRVVSFEVPRYSSPECERRYRRSYFSDHLGVEQPELGQNAEALLFAPQQHSTVSDCRLEVEITPECLALVLA